MLAQGHQTDELPYINMTPMVDVVLCLLIFFMVATRLYDWDENQFTVRVPEVAKAAPLTAAPEDLTALALAYFEDLHPEPPEELAATLGDIAGIVRHAAERISDPERRRAYDEAVDAIDDGLAADVMVDRLARAFGDGGDVVAHLRRRIGT